MKTMNVAQAKAKLSELIESALHGEDVCISRNGKPVVKLVVMDEALIAKPDRANFFGRFEGFGALSEEALSPEPLDAWFSEQPLQGFEPPSEQRREG